MASKIRFNRFGHKSITRLFGILMVLMLSSVIFHSCEDQLFRADYWVQVTNSSDKNIYYNTETIPEQQLVKSH